MKPSARDEVLKLYQFCQKLEKNFESKTRQDLQLIQNSLDEIAKLEGLHLDKLHSLKKHISPDMTLRHFQNLLVPLERWLNRAVKDDDFLVRSEDNEKSRTHFPLILVLDHLRSAFNVGAFFRLADALGAEKIILSGYTPTPQTTAVQKTALGSEDSVPWEWVENLQSYLQAHQDTHQIIAWETADNAKNCEDKFLQKPTIFLFGNERFGLEKDRLQLSHEIRQIKMSGTKNSLNVAQSAAIATFEWRRQWLSSR